MRTVPIEWNGRIVQAADPDPIADWVPELSSATVRRTEQAAAALARLADSDRHPGLLAARLLHRAEGVASSEIEALRVGGRSVALAEVAGDAQVDSDARWVADNLATVLEALADRRPIDSRTITDWHRRLMRHGRIAPEHVGAWRDRLGWIGGHSPLVAVHVAVPAERIDLHMQDLHRFCAREDLDPITLAAVAHAHFETIHPFADGNGRIGRVLISNLLARRCRIDVPPPVSLQIRRDVGGYQAGLSLYRLGMVDEWVRWFADAVIISSDLAEGVLADVTALISRWRDAVARLRADSAARRLVDHLPDHPVLDSTLVASLLDVSAVAARVALSTLTEAGVLARLDTNDGGPGRPRRWFAAVDLLDLLD